jgi:hypothetical protein
MGDDLDAVKRRWEALSIDEKIDILYRAEANGVELPPMLIPIFEAVRDADQRPVLIITEDTTDEEINKFLFSHP